MMSHTAKMFASLFCLVLCIAAMASFTHKAAPTVHAESSSQKAQSRVGDGTIDLGRLAYKIAEGKPYLASQDGRYAVTGDVLDLRSGKNLVEVLGRRSRKAILPQLEGLGEFAYAAPSERYHVTVFFDIECGYCKLMYAQTQSYLDAGITINYVLYPRDGVSSHSYYQSVAVWCDANRKQALDKAMRGRFKVKDVLLANCANPIAKGFSLGKSIGVTGTPTIVFANGRLRAGYLDPSSLMAELSH